MQILNFILIDLWKEKQKFRNFCTVKSQLNLWMTMNIIMNYELLYYGHNTLKKLDPISTTNTFPFIQQTKLLKSIKYIVSKFLTPKVTELKIEYVFVEAASACAPVRV